jgi:hypothetical protein
MLSFHRYKIDEEYCIVILRAETEGVAREAGTSATGKGKMSCEGCKVLIDREGEARHDECSIGRFLDKEVLCDSAGEHFTVDFYICCNCRDGRALRRPDAVHAPVCQHKGERVCDNCKIRVQERETWKRRQAEAKQRAETEKLKLQEEEKRMQAAENEFRAKEQATLEARDRLAEEIRQEEVQKQTEVMTLVKK